MRALSLLITGALGLALVGLSLTAGGAATAAPPDCGSVGYTQNPNGAFEVGTLSQLQCVGDSLDGPGLDQNYRLTADINATSTSAWNGNSGFDPIGNSSNPFTGTFDGEGHAISNLTIDRRWTDGVGLFGTVGTAGTVRNVGLVDAAITGTESVGGVAGESNGTVLGSFVTGSLAGRYSVGGVVGHNRGTIDTSYTTANVSGDTSDDVGRDIAVVEPVQPGGQLVQGLQWALDANDTLDVLSDDQLLESVDQYDAWVLNNVSGGADDLSSFLDQLDDSQGTVFLENGGHPDSRAISALAAIRDDLRAHHAKDAFYEAGWLTEGNCCVVGFNMRADHPILNITDMRRNPGLKFNPVHPGMYGITSQALYNVGGVPRAWFTGYDGRTVAEVYHVYHESDGPSVAINDTRNEVLVSLGHTQKFNQVLSESTAWDVYVPVLNRSYELIANAVNEVGNPGMGSIGGLAGQNGQTGTVTESYVAGDIATTTSGGLLGTNNGFVADSYWDRNATGQAGSAGGTGLTTEQLKGNDSLAGFDFDTTWDVRTPASDERSYPFLTTTEQSPPPGQEILVSSLSDLDIAGQGSDATVAAGTNHTVTFNVSYTGTQTQEFTLTRSVSNAAVPDTQQVVSLGPNDWTQVSVDLPATLDATTQDYTVTVTAVTRSLTGQLAVHPDITGDRTPALDTDGDQLLEDVDGDGYVNIKDSTTLLAYIDSTVLGEHAGMFDFSEFSPPNKVNVLDIAAHWREHVYNAG
jgi:hypothetical protein